MIEHVAIITLLTISLLQCFKKWGWLDWYAAKYGHITWLPKADCYLCLGFWLSGLVMNIYFTLLLIGAEVIVLPLAAAGLINILLTHHENN